MSNESGNSSQIFSVQKGGTALSGLYESSAPDLYTGTGNFTVTISLPTGKNGFQPILKLVYGTGSGNEPFRLGWGLNIPGISRKFAEGVPCFNDARDVFILSGAEDLVSVNQDYGIVYHRPRTEGLFARIEHHHDEEIDQNCWKVSSKDVLISWCGTPLPYDADVHWQDPSTITDPAYPAKIFALRLKDTNDF